MNKMQITLNYKEYTNDCDAVSIALDIDQELPLNKIIKKIEQRYFYHNSSKYEKETASIVIKWKSEII